MEFGFYSKAKENPLDGFKEECNTLAAGIPRLLYDLGQMNVPLRTLVS